MEFQEITLADKHWMQPLLNMSDFRSEEYNFTFCYIWRNVFSYRVARMNDYLLVKSCRPDRPTSYLYPAGSGDVTPVLKALEEDAAKEGLPLTFHTVLAEQKAYLETLYPGQYTFIALDNYYDYVYETQSLITLSGKKLHAKRNHINRFMTDNPDWSYEPITAENLPEVTRMSNQWLGLHSEDSVTSLEQESQAVCMAIRNYVELGMDGGLIRAGGRVVAFSMGDRLNSDTYLVHIEKAFGDVQGAYAIINQQFAMHNCKDYRYINREDDSGQLGLRKAKQSYRPAMMVEKYGAKLMR